MSDTDSPATFDTEKDAGEGQKGIVNRWLAEIKLAKKAEEDWRKDASEAWGVYTSGQKTKTRFNIYWANVETLRPALFSRMPVPDVRRRFRDDDPAGKQAAEIAQRGLSYALDDIEHDFEETLELAILDYLVAGRGVIRVRYEPVYDTLEETWIDPDTDQPVTGTYQDLVFERAVAETVPWDRFIVPPARAWKKLPWIAFEHHIKVSEAKQKFSKNASGLKPDVSMNEDDDKGQKNEAEDIFRRIRVYEIWDKEKREVLFIAPGKPDGPLLVQADPLGLPGFFPVPRPLYAVPSTKSVVPVCEYRYYREQLEDLNEITRRINRLIKAIKLRGVYDSTVGELERLLDGADENELIPAENIRRLLEVGGIEKAIHYLPIEMIAKVLAELIKQRDEVKAVIYEMSGISDILRGASNPNETARAQSIKAQYGSLRIDARRRSVQRFVRDVLRLLGCIQAQHFERQTLEMMTNLPVPPGVLEILQSRLLMQFRTDIETDSTIAADLEEEQRGVAKLLGSITQFMTAMAPLVQSGAVPLEVAKELLMAAVRRSRLGNTVEDALDKIGQPPGGMPVGTPGAIPGVAPVAPVGPPPALMGA